MLKVDVEGKTKLPEVHIGDAIQLSKDGKKFNGMIVQIGSSCSLLSLDGVPSLLGKWDPVTTNDYFLNTSVYFDFYVLKAYSPENLLSILAKEYDHIEKLQSMTIKITEDED